MTTDSTSEDDIVPPPLPAKTREHSDYTNLPNAVNASKNGALPGSKHKYRPLPDIPNTPYDMVDAKNFAIEDKRRPPTPPPKPSRNSKYISAQ